MSLDFALKDFYRKRKSNFPYVLTIALVIALAEFLIYFSISLGVNLIVQNNIFYSNGISNDPYFYDSKFPTVYNYSDNIIDNPDFYSDLNFHPKSGSPAIDAGIPVVDVGIQIFGLKVDLDGIPIGDPPNIGCFETIADLASPSYVSSVIEDSVPDLLIISYNMPLLKIIPDISAFEVMVNLQTSNIVSIEIIEGKIHITLESPVSYGDTITVSYTIPPNNPLQSIANIKAESIFNRDVINNVNPKSSEDSPSLTLDIYPNPVKDYFNINIEGDIPETANILRISDGNGSVVFEKPFVPEMLSSTININLSPGLYIALLLSKDKILGVGKILVIK